MPAPGLQLRQSDVPPAMRQQPVALPPPEVYQPEAMPPPKAVNINGAEVVTSPTPTIDAVTTAKPADIVDSAVLQFCLLCSYLEYGKKVTRMPCNLLEI